MAKIKSVKASSAQLRIIAGRWRGRKLPVANLPSLRPTGDRIRETLFNWLMGDIVGARVLDLFSGAGSLGLESLSRGAAALTLIEQHPTAVKQLQQNLELLDASSSAVLIQSDAVRWLQQGAEQPFDLVFIDPPFSENLWQASFEGLETGGYLTAGSAIYIECERERTLQIPDNWQLFRQKRAGQVCFSLYYRH